MSEIQFWADLRLLLYPVLIVGGLAWSLGFWMRYRVTRYSGDVWAGRAGAAVTLLGLAGTSALMVSKVTGFTIVTTVLITLGVLGLAVVMVWGALALLVGGWRTSGGPSAGSGDGSAQEADEQ